MDRGTVFGIFFDIIDFRVAEIECTPILFNLFAFPMAMYCFAIFTLYSFIDMSHGTNFHQREFKIAKSNPLCILHAPLYCSGWEQYVQANQTTCQIFHSNRTLHSDIYVH